ncbi:sodium/potassium-transporting ATPase subunit beta-like [Pollicipes pollicipes]|uniref:sodium/potassium-transporting ATPase subunit beta-like n=1 Tax=Pollicipes pollicipes TaxID=41117 RepID=UPI0018859931|nr:sodium/potassium-transporting ATPase subunit beta-like [Pollicipes pollicipes]
MPAKAHQSIRDFLWNSEEKKFLGRTGSSWLKIGIFYVIFYACLLAFWTLCLVIFLQTLNLREPKWTTKTGSLIGDNPGLGFRPRPPTKSIESTLIWFNQGKGENWGHWVTELTNVTESYRFVDPNAGAQLTTCNYDKQAGKNQFCEFKIDELGGRCTKERRFGYEEGRPCIIVKLNKIYNWVPDFYTSVAELPKKMPKTVRDRIARDFTNSSSHITKKNVWITCEGENPADVENIGLVNYYPHPGMPSFYYPFTNVQGYQSPLVAVEFSDVKSGVLINIECKAWAKNIKHDRKERRGSVHFELMVD